MLQFAKGQSSSTRTPDSIVTNDTVEVLLGIGEGPCAGLVEGPKSFYLDDTPLVNESGDPNFSNFALQYYPGELTGHTIKMELGGFTNPINIGQTLSQNIPVTRSGVTTGIDAVDFRILVQQLVKQTDKGTFTAPLKLKFEVKKHTDATWRPAWLSDVSNLSDPVVAGSEQSWVSYGGVLGTSYTFEGDRIATTSTSNPSGTGASQQVHVNTTNNTVWSWGSNTWNQLTTTPGSGYQVLQSGERLYDPSTVAPSGARSGDLWLKQAGVLLIWNGTSWVSPQTPVAQIQDGIWSVDAKVSSNTSKDFRVFLENDPTTTWEFRVTKLSEDSGDQISSVIAWESIQEIKTTPRTFTGVTMVRVIGQASDQFTNLPNMSGEYKGRIVKVPTNYNPDTRAYTGIWDGTFKMAWTDNPAWIFQDYVENETYGLSSIYPHTVNKWRIYEWAKHCDTMVARPNGQTRPRWTFNDYIQTSRDAKEQANYIAGAAGARYVDDGNGMVDILIDRDEDAVALFTLENVSPEGFSYSYTDRLTRPNEVIVEFVNPALTWQTDKRVVRDDEDITTFGRISENFIAVGCTDEDEAMARARRRLIGGLTEKEMINFTTNRQGRFLSEMDVILVSDPKMGRGLTGRIKGAAGTNSVQLRDPITIEAGFTYYAIFQTLGLDTVRIQITNGAGTHTSLNFFSSLPTLPEYATFAIECAGQIGVPKPYRVLNIEDPTGAGEVIKITALELNRNKWSFIDTGGVVDETDYGSYNKEVPPPTNLKVTTSVRQKGLISTRVATLSWTKSTSNFVRLYRINHMVNGQAVESPAPQPQTSCEFEGIADGEHIFSVVAIDLFGRESRPAVIKYDTNGVTPISGQFNFRLINGNVSNVYNDIEPVFSWDPIALMPHFDHYEVLVLGPLGLPLRIDNVGQALTWTYKHEVNKADHSGDPPRELTIGLRAVDQYGNSSQPDLVTVTNPAPPAPSSLMMQVDGDGWIVKWAPVSVADFGGTRIKLNGTQVAEERGSQARIPLAMSGDYTLQVGHFDLYKPSETIWASEVSQSIAKLVQETINDLTATVEAGQATLDSLSAQISDIDPTMRAILELTLRVDEIRDRLNVRTIKNQKTVGTLIQQLQTQREADQEAFAEFQTVLGAWSGDHQSWILDTLKVKASPTETFAQMLSRLEASDATNAASVTSETTARIAGDAAEATARSALAATVSSVSAALTSESTARVSGDTSIVQRIDRFITENGDQTAAILNDSYVKLSTGGLTIASTLSGMQTSIGNNSAAIASEVTTRTSQYSSMASSITTLSSNVGSLSSSVTTLQSAVNGMGAKWSVALNVNGYISGLVMNNDGSTSTIAFLCSNFTIVDPNFGAPFAPFVYSGGVIRLTSVYMSGNLLVDGTITGAKIVGGAVSNLDASSSAPSLALSTGEQGVIARTLTVDGGKVTVDIYCGVSNTGANAGVRARLYRNGTLIDEGAWFAMAAFGSSGTMKFYDNPGAGTHTYQVNLNLTAGSGTSVTSLVNRMIITELKK